MSAQPAYVPQFRNVDNIGNALYNGLLYTYVAGTTTPQATYTDSTQTTQNTNPVVLNARGEASIWLNPLLTYKFVLQDQFGNTIWTQDQIPGGFVPGSQFIASVLAALLEPYTSAPILNSLAQTAAELAAGVTPVNYAYAPGDIRRYGALTSAGDNSTAILAAIAQAQQSTGTVTGASIYVPTGTWKHASALVVSSGPVRIYGDGIAASILQKTANVVSIAVNGSNLTLENIQILGTSGSDTNDGIQVNTTGHARLSQVASNHHGGHGINVLQANICYFGDITTAFNAGDGFRLTGSGGIQANANTILNVNSISNTGWGMNLVTANANMGTGLTLQSNTSGGINIQTCFGNMLGVYCEANTGPSINFASTCVAPNYGGNLITAAFWDTAPVFNSTSGNGNAVLTSRAGPAYQVGFSQVIPDLITFSNNTSAGGSPEGVFQISHANNLELDVVLSGFSATGKTKFSNAAGGSNLHGLQADNLVAVANAAGFGGAGVLSIGSGTATTATTGSSGAPPAQVLGYLVFNLAGNPIKIPYYNN
jgi:hypothetical protein